MIEVERVGEQRDCKHCSRTYGTLGCCSTVSNKWVYSCEEGHREYEETHKHMTIPEAIEVLAQDLPCETDEDLVEAMAMAIKALEQQPCEDCISRQATVERLCKVANFMNEKREGLGSPYIMAALFIQDNKDEFPPVTPKEKTGHWEYVQYDGNPNIGNLHCSECDRIAGLEYKYCPNCGARMQEVEENG